MTLYEQMIYIPPLWLRLAMELLADYRVVWKTGFDH